MHNNDVIKLHLLKRISSHLHFIFLEGFGSRKGTGQTSRGQSVWGFTNTKDGELRENRGPDYPCMDNGYARVGKPQMTTEPVLGIEATVVATPAPSTKIFRGCIHKNMHNCT